MTAGAPDPAAGPSALPAPFLFSVGGAARVTARAAGGVLILTTRAEAATSSRSLAPSPPWDHVGVLHLRRGAVNLDVGERLTALNPGDLAVLDLLCPFRLLSERCVDTLLVIPRVSARVLAGSARHGAVVRADHPASELLAGYVEALAGDDLTARGAAAAVEGLAALLAACAANPANGIGGSLARRLAERIDADLTSVDLSPARLAALLGVSRATLYRALGGGEGVAAVLRERRLDRAFALLSDPGMAGESLGSIARMVGFSGTDQLSRLFLARFGQRAAAVGAARRGPPAEADGGRIEAWMRALEEMEPCGGAAQAERITA